MLLALQKIHPGLLVDFAQTFYNKIVLKIRYGTEPQSGSRVSHTKGEMNP